MVERRSRWASISVWALIISNLVPLYGVLFHGWSVFPIVLLFWTENVVIGVLNVVRMIVAQPPEDAAGGGGAAAKAFMIPFFCVHYGIFTLVHGVFVFALFAGDAFEGVDNIAEMKDALVEAIGTWHLGWALLGLFASHLLSFFSNFIGRGEYRRYSLGKLLSMPYGRVVILHLAILGGGFLTMLLGSPVWALVILLLVKIMVDLGAHVLEHADEA